jgi:hypothetical protein
VLARKPIPFFPNLPGGIFPKSAYPYYMEGVFGFRDAMKALVTLTTLFVVLPVSLVESFKLAAGSARKSSGASEAEVPEGALPRKVTAGTACASVSSF